MRLVKAVSATGDVELMQWKAPGRVMAVMLFLREGSHLVAFFNHLAKFHLEAEFSSLSVERQRKVVWAIQLNPGLTKHVIQREMDAA